MTTKRKRTELGRELAKLRIDFSETATEMAKKLGVSSSNLFNIETGVNASSYELILKVKELYGKDMEQLFLNGGGLSRVVLEMDLLSEEDRKTAVLLWCKCNDIELPEQAAKEVAPTVGATGAKPRKPPPLPDDVGFISEQDTLTDDDLENLDDL